MYTDSSFIALFRSILVDPFDGTSRLVLADWLEEHDDVSLAKRVRRHVENGMKRWDDPFGVTVTATLAEFRRTAIALFSKKVVTTVRITDVTPGFTSTSRKRRRIHWLTQSRLTSQLFDWLPVEPRPLYELRVLRGELAWGTRGGKKVALTALSDACVSFGRESAGLPPLRKA
jgi:uncharacterized protein (TIGR02996 family)